MTLYMLRFRTGSGLTHWQEYYRERKNAMRALQQYVEHQHQYKLKANKDYTSYKAESTNWRGDTIDEGTVEIVTIATKD